MNVTAIRPNFTANNAYRRNNNQNSQQAFKGAQSAEVAEKVFQRLAERNTEVVDNFQIGDLGKFIEHMVDKYRGRKFRSAGVQVVNNNDLPKVLGENASKYDTKGKIGLCIAVGDKPVPVEQMGEIYEAKTVLVAEETFKRHKN